MSGFDSTRYHRQLDLVDVQELHDLKVGIVGVGAVGSVVAVQLAKMGVGNFILWDFDKVEAHNLPNQFFREKDMGTLKVEAVANSIKEFNMYAVVMEKKEGLQETDVNPFEGLDVVIMAVDSMELRKTFWEKFVHMKVNPKFYIEARMAAETFRIYSLRPTAYKETKEYADSLYSDEDATQEKCTARAIMYNVFILSGFIGNLIKRFVNREETVFETLGDTVSNLYYFNE